MYWDQLPHDIVMRIIRDADGGIYTHRKKMNSSLNVLKDLGYKADAYVKNMEQDKRDYWEKWNYAFRGWYDSMRYFNPEDKFHRWIARDNGTHIEWSDDESSSEEEDFSLEEARAELARRLGPVESSSEEED